MYSTELQCTVMMMMRIIIINSILHLILLFCTIQHVHNECFVIDSSLKSIMKKQVRIIGKHVEIFRQNP